METHGFEAVETYIQSGNVLFETDAPRAELEDSVEAVLAQRLKVPVVVVVRSHRQLRNVVDNAPAGFGSEPDTYLSDVVFLKAPLTSARAMRSVERRDGVDGAWPGSGVVYFRRLQARASSSKLSKITQTEVYPRISIRNWATTTKLLTMLDERAGA